jgi:ribosomal protein S17
VRIEESRPLSKRKHWIVLSETETVAEGAGGAVA